MKLSEFEFSTETHVLLLFHAPVSLLLDRKFPEATAVYNADDAQLIIISKLYIQTVTGRET